MRERGLLKPQDLRRADLLLAAEPPDPEGGLFHSQQAAEKVLESFLTWHNVPFRRVHELDELGEQCIGIDSSLAELICRADALTKYACSNLSAVQATRNRDVAVAPEGAKHPRARGDSREGPSFRLE